MSMALKRAEIDAAGKYSGTLSKILGVDIDDGYEEQKVVKTTQTYCQWSQDNNSTFFPTKKTTNKLPVGVYNIWQDPNGRIFFEKQTIVSDGILRFPQTNCDTIVKEIETFWQREEKFALHDINYTRGLLLYGVPGGGKSCILKLIMQDVVGRGGIIVNFNCSPELFSRGMNSLREIEPETPIVVLMEDIDAIIRKYNESEVLNILDGVGKIRKVVYLATTNYPEVLGQRIINRPSRFDKRFRIELPNEESRRIYLEFLMEKDSELKDKVNIDQWVKDTEDFTLAHIKELFVAVCIIGNEYNEALETLQEMQNKQPDSSEDFKKKTTFGFAK